MAAVTYSSTPGSVREFRFAALLEMERGWVEMEVISCFGRGFFQASSHSHIEEKYLTFVIHA